MYKGFFFGLFLVGCFTARLLIEIIKEPQVEFEKAMALDMGQLLSIPFIIYGIVILVISFRKKLPARRQLPKPVKKEPTHYAKSLRNN